MFRLGPAAAVQEMHQVLLIDETLRAILEFCLDNGKNSLCCVARCCKAWKDPALDCIWRHLPSAVPLMAILPGFSVDAKTGTIVRYFKCKDPRGFNSLMQNLEKHLRDENLTAFIGYANRVQYISFRHQIKASTDIWLRLCKTGHLLPSLQGCCIGGPAVRDLRLCTSLSPRLEKISLNVGYATSELASTLTHGVLAQLRENRVLQCLAIRGYNTTCLQQPFSALVTLQSLWLYLSMITEPTFMAISSLPVLSDLDIHATALSFERLSSAVIDHCARGEPFFQSLRCLKVRAQLPVIKSILRHIPPNNLLSLHMDIDNGAQSIPWHSTLLTITAATSRLYELILEDIVLTDDPRDIQLYPPDNALTIDNLRLLSQLPIRHLILDVSLVPDLSDADIEEIVTWWPFLESLHLGVDTALENMQSAWQPKMTLASLYALGKGCRQLSDLVIALDVASAIPQILCKEHRQLSSLTISSHSRPNPESLPVFLKSLFPCLQEITPGHVGDNTGAWDSVQDNFDRFSILPIQE